jgi:hypothetical protein
MMRRLFFALVICSVAPSAMAAMVTYRFAGTATGASGIFAGQGTGVTGTFSFDDGLLDQITDATTDEFANDTPAANQALTASFRAALTIGSVTVTRGSTDPLRQEGDLIFDTADEDIVRFDLLRQVPDEDMFGLQATDPQGVAIPALTSTIAGAMSILNGMHLNVCCGPGQFSDATGYWNAYSDLGGDLIGAVGFKWTEVAPVPLPAAFLLLSSGVIGFLGIGARSRRATA